MARSTRLVILIRNIYTIWGRKRCLPPVTYFPTNLVYPLTIRVLYYSSYTFREQSLYWTLYKINDIPRKKTFIKFKKVCNRLIYHQLNPRTTQHSANKQSWLCKSENKFLVNNKCCCACTFSERQSVLQHLRSAREKKVALSDKLSPIGQLFTIVDKAVDRLDIISVEVKQMNARVLTWEREVADLR